MEADRTGGDGMPLEQPAREARVLRGDQRNVAKDLDGPERDVAEIADRRRDDVQRSATLGLG